ncbi:MAG: M20/M25/M40 family metallo-hydrolase [Promethearchaeota archaeon]
MNEETSSWSKNNLKNLISSTNETFIREDLTSFLKIPSYTSNREAIKEAKNYITSYISNFCENITEIKGEINPLLLAEVNGEVKEKLLIYMMYDTQPIHNEREWIKKPFEAEITDLSKPLDKIGKVIIARGAYNSKTPLLCFLNVVKLLKEEEKLPISLLLLIDGEEEIGSPTLLKSLKIKSNTFNSCVDAYYPSLKQDLDGNSVIKLGYKGILSLTIKVFSNNKESHSSFSGIIPNPSVDLVSILNLIYNNNNFKIKCLGNPYKLTSDEETLFNASLENLNIEKVKRKAGIEQTNEENIQKAFFNYLFKPTFNISTLKSGFLKEGIKNYVPSQAICNIDIRFAHDVSTEEIFTEIKQKIKDFATISKSHVEITKNIGYESSRIKKDSTLVKSLVKSASLLGFSTKIWPLSAAAAPLSRIQKELGISFLTGGLGIGGYAHAPNEFVQVKSIQNTRLSNCLFLKNYSDLYSEI